MTFVDFLAYSIFLGFGFACLLRECIRYCEPSSLLEDEIEEAERK